MSESFIQSPSDAANTGPRSRTYTFTAGSNIVHARLGGLVDEAGNELGFPVAEPVAAAAPAIPVRQPAGSVFAVGGPITDAQLRAAPVPVTVGNFPAGFNVNNAVQLAAGGNAVGSVSVSNFPATQAVSIAVVPSHAVTGPATNAELRATPLPVSGTVAVSGAVEIQNDLGNPIPVSGTVALAAGVAAIGAVTVSNFPATQNINIVAQSGAVAVSGPLTDAQLRAAAVPVSGTFFQATQPVSGSVSLAAGAAAIGSVAVSNFPATQAVSLADSAARVLGVTSVSNFPATQAVSLADSAARVLGTVSLAAGTNAAGSFTVGGWLGSAAPTVGQKAMASSLPVALASDQAAIPAYDRPPTVHVSGSSAAGAALTLTLPAPGAGLSHYISAIEISLYSSAARTGAAAPWISSATNCAFLDKIAFSTAGAIGAVDRFVPSLVNPLKAAAPATATVLTLPIATGGIWSARIGYFVGA